MEEKVEYKAEEIEKEECCEHDCKEEGCGIEIFDYDEFYDGLQAGSYIAGIYAALVSAGMDSEYAAELAKTKMLTEHENEMKRMEIDAQIILTEKEKIDELDYSS